MITKLARGKHAKMATASLAATHTHARYQHACPQYGDAWMHSRRKLHKIINRIGERGESRIRSVSGSRFSPISGDPSSWPVHGEASRRPRRWTRPRTAPSNELSSRARETSPSRRRRRLDATFRVTASPFAVSRRRSAILARALHLIPYNATLAERIVTIDRYARRSREKLNSRISTDRRRSPLVF